MQRIYVIPYKSKIILALQVNAHRNNIVIDNIVALISFLTAAYLRSE